MRIPGHRSRTVALQYPIAYPALFGAAGDELLGLRSAGKRGPASRLQQQIERLGRLPKATQKVVLQMLDGVLSQTNR